MRTLGILTRSVVVAIALATGLTACAVDGEAGPSPEPTVTETAAPEGTHPSAAYDIQCDEIVDTSRLDAVVAGSTPEPQPLYLSPDDFGMVGAAVLQAGGLACVWRGETYDTGLTVIALPDALDGLSASIEAILAARPNDGGHVETSVADGGLVKCQRADEYRAPACDWTVAAGDSWLYVRTAGLAEGDVVAPPPNPDTSIPPATPAEGSAAEALVEDIATAIADSGRQEVVPTVAVTCQSARR